MTEPIVLKIPHEGIFDPKKHVLTYQVNGQEPVVIGNLHDLIEASEKNKTRQRLTDE